MKRRHPMPYIPLGVTQQGRTVPTLEAAMNTDIEPWHLPHLERAAGFGLTEADLDRAQRARECAAKSLGDMLLACGAVEGPFKPTRPTTRWTHAAQRFTRKVLAFVLAPRCNL